LAVRFVVFGDTKGKENGINKKVLQGILKKVKELSFKPDFFISLGDSIAGSSKSHIHRQQMQEFKNTIRKWFPETIILPVVGNHEVNNEPADDTYEMIFKEEYLTFRQHGALSGFNGTAYYMDLEYCRFIVLNCYHYGQLKKIDHEQLQWFKQVSKEDKKFKLAFVHCPPYPTGAHEGTCLDEFKEYRDSFCEAAKESKIDIIFSGHEHNYSRRLIEGNTEGVLQIISGGGGEKLRKSYTSREGVIVPPVAQYHFVVVDMDETIIRAQAVSTEGVSIDLFSINK
jgi:3',5'-cyclic-AMP phosphodiesterase